MKKVSKPEKKVENKEEKPVEKKGQVNPAEITLKRKATAEQRGSRVKKKIVKKGLIAPVYDIEGKEIGNIDLPKEIFSVKASKSLLAQYVRVYLANQRQGTQSTKTRGEVIGSTRKIYKQKGTGRARHGAIKAPIFVGGGIAHGPKPRDFSLKMNKKQRRKVFFSVLSQRLSEGKICFVEGLLKTKPKTKEFIKILKNLKLDKEKSVFLVCPKEESENLSFAVRNIKNVGLDEVGSINAYQILKSRKIIFAKEALPVLIRRSGVSLNEN